MKKELYTIRKNSETNFWYTFTEKNAKGETLVVELSFCKNCGGSHALPVLWKQHGYIDRVLETYWCMSTYVTDSEENCWGRYNPQTKLSDDGKRAVINFDWMFEATEENKEKLLDEVYRLWSEATGKTATEIKVRKVKEYAEFKHVEVLTEMPEGWIDLGYRTAPIGATWIGNMKPTIHNIKDANRKEALLILS